MVLTEKELAILESRIEHMKPNKHIHEWPFPTKHGEWTEAAMKKPRSLDEAWDEENKVKEIVGEVRSETTSKDSNAVDHPKHYNSHPSGIECIVVAEHYNFCIGNAMKYLWRAGLKEGSQKEKEDCEKAIWYVKRHIESL